jgi:hypothetical protein
MTRYFQVAGGLLVAGCAALGAGGRQPAEQRFTGQLIGCGGGATAATLTRTGDAIAFAPDDGVLVLRGTVAADGTFTARLNTQPAGKPAYLLTAAGQVGEDGATVSFAAPTCARATATLTRVRGGLF